MKIFAVIGAVVVFGILGVVAYRAYKKKKTDVPTDQVVEADVGESTDDREVGGDMPDVLKAAFAIQDFKKWS